MVDVLKATRYIAVAEFSSIVVDEWKEWYRRNGQTYQERPPAHKDYALLKVLTGLRRNLTTKKNIPIHVFQYEQPVTGLDFSGLEDSDYVFVVGHGNDKGLYPMGPSAEEGSKRLIDILTKDGNLKSKRKEKKAAIALLSCRAGLGFHTGLARKLFKTASISCNVGGALGFTFGSIRTSWLAQNEVLIQGIPWHMEFPQSITAAEAEAHTSAREGKNITIADNQAEIDQFKADKSKLEEKMKELVDKLNSTEVNAALDELDTKKFQSKWKALLWEQFALYSTAKKKANLEFDMWYDKMPEGYVWADSAKVTDAQATSALTGELTPTDDGLTSTR